MIPHIKCLQTILYVSDQEKSAQFYQKIFRKIPDLNVPGMSEFILSDVCKVGLMPINGIIKILNGKTQDPNIGNGIPRCELYLLVDNVETEFKNATNCGASLVSPILEMDWGDRVCYFMDPDGHIIAFAEKI